MDQRREVKPTCIGPNKISEHEGRIYAELYSWRSEILRNHDLNSIEASKPITAHFRKCVKVLKWLTGAHTRK